MRTVKEVSKLLDLTEHTVRFYTDKGLVPSVQRDKNNNRLFDEESISWLIGVKYLKQCGMSVEDIKSYVDLCLEGRSTIHERYDIIMKQKAIALTQLDEAKQRAKYMEEKANHYLDIINGVVPDDTNPKEWESINSNTPQKKEQADFLLIQSIVHIAIVVRDYDEALEFYTKKLNFSLVEDTYQPEQDKRWVVVSPPGSAGTTILLARASKPEQEPFIGNQTGGRVFLFLSTDDFWRDYNEMVSRGIEFVREPKKQSYGKVAVFKDLYGNLWDLLEFNEDHPISRRIK